MTHVFLDACKRKKVEYTPVWFMRQAGRYLPSYAKMKGNRGVLQAVKDPELASDIAVEPVKLLGTDAAIIYADIMIPLEAIGIDLSIKEHYGPLIARPFKSEKDVERIKELKPEKLYFLGEAIKKIKAKLQKSIPVIGFSAAPFTLASYLIEGGPSSDFVKTRMAMHDEILWQKIMGSLVDLISDYLAYQVEYGIDAVQLFDSWAGAVSSSDYERFILPYTKRVFSNLPANLPKIHFCANSSHLIEKFAQTGADVLSVDWRVDIASVWKRTDEKLAVQGNLDPALAVVGGKEMQLAVSKIMQAAYGHKGHIFNLGHGVLKETNPENLKKIVKIVHRWEMA
ncbi:MAG: uroporphyrinogen decarboxylase [Nitrososphaerota archaeon]